MKIKTSMKICNNFKHVYRVGYCDMQYIMLHCEPRFYNCGVYGWNCDLYIDFATDTVITTGYRNMRGKLVPDEIFNKYNEAAKKIIKDHDYTQYKEQAEALERNRTEFFKELANC